MKKLGQIAIAFVFCIFAWVANVIFVYWVFFKSTNFGLWLLPEAWQPYWLLVCLALATVLPLTAFVFAVGAVLSGKDLLS
jgi:hypothetical protein